MNKVVHVMTIANSIIGVSIIAMPFCFKQCGILLSTLILIVSSIISRLSCHLLLKSAIISRRRTFEFLAFHVFGSLGKLIIEICLIGFLLGTCIAFFVVMGDLGPAIVIKMTGTKATDTLRTSILMALALFCVLPLGLLRNIDSLTSVCTATIGFYFCLLLKIMMHSVPHIFSGDWMEKVELWRPAGFLQCLPIFSMALFCQTQIFEIYQTIPNASLEKMNDLIRVAVNICTSVYIFVGIFGYIAFSGQTFSGNILMSFPSSIMSEAIKIGFVLSVAFSFPLIIFPCRASLYSLLYKQFQTHPLHEAIDKYIPEGRFKGLTFVIVLVSLVTGVMIPNIELVLGLLGSTIGVMICVLFPAMCFICVSTKNTNERILAQIMLFIGVIVMVLGTYANLYASDEFPTNPVIAEKILINEPIISKMVQDESALKVMDIPNTSKLPIALGMETNRELEKQETIKEVRHEPPQPEEPAESPAKEAPKTPPPILKEIKPEEVIIKSPLQENPKELNIDAKEKVIEAPVPQDRISKDKVIEAPVPQDKLGEEKRDVNEDKANNVKTSKKLELVAAEAIEKEDKEILEQETEEKKKQLKLEEEKTKLIEELEKQKAYKAEFEKEKIKAVKEIEAIAKKTIERLGAGTNVKEDSNKENRENLLGKEDSQLHVERSEKSENIEKSQNAVENLNSQNKKNKNTLLKVDNRENEIVQIIEPQNEQIKNGHLKSDRIENINLLNENNKQTEETKKAAELRNLKINPDFQDEHIQPETKNVVLESPQEDNKNIKTNNLDLKQSQMNSIKDVNKTQQVQDSSGKVVQNSPVKGKKLKSRHTVNILVNKQEETPFKKIAKNNIVPLPLAGNVSEVYKNLAAKIVRSKSLSEDNTNKEQQQKESKQDTVNLLEFLGKPEKTNEDFNAHREIRSVKEKENKISDTVKSERCDKSEKTSTEKSLIKMIDKLSDPELVSIKLPEANEVSLVKSLKRDLKSYDEKRRK